MIALIHANLYGLEYTMQPLQNDHSIIVMNDSIKSILIFRIIIVALLFYRKYTCHMSIDPFIIIRREIGKTKNETVYIGMHRNF